MSTVGELDFDPDELRERYRRERDKRLREDGQDQYVEMAGQYAHFVEDDPYAQPFERDPLAEEVDVVVLGAGFSGLLASARLLEAGVDDFRVVDAAGDFGGTWYWNRYPGAQCDIESYCYLPLLEELGYTPKEKYSYVPEIFDHARRIGKHFGLYDKALFQTRVQSLRWDDTLGRWRVKTSRGDDLKARFVISALGPVSKAKLPGVEGIEDFEGHSFHTSRWDYGYTGGDWNGGMTKLADKRVAIIGTGATAVQCVPFLARDARELYVFQRTPSAVQERGNKLTDADWWASLKPGWQRERRDNFGAFLSGQIPEVDLVDDRWTYSFRKMMSMDMAVEGEFSIMEIMDKMEVADFELMNEIRQRVEDTVEDPETAEKLKPYYRLMCKRPVFNDEYLPAFNQPNVKLVDVSETRGIERITKKGIVANGREYEVDCIVYATGFEITTRFERRFDIEITGRDGVSLFDHWKDGLKTFHGFMTTKFPNWFYMGISQNALSINMTAMFDDQARHLAYLVAEGMKRGDTIEPTQESQDKWVSGIQAMQVPTVSFMETCTPGYYNNEGENLGGPSGAGVYTPGLKPFAELLEQWRNQGDMDGLKID